MKHYMHIALTLMSFTVSSLAYADYTSGKITYIDDPKRIAQVVEFFQKSLDRADLGWRVKQCSHIIGVSPADGRDYSYGASCNITAGKKPRAIFICNDEMIGTLTISFSGVLDSEWIEDFVTNNCRPGG